MTRVQLADHLAGRDVQGGVEARGAVALVVVRRALGRARQHRQRRRSAIERLDLRFLVDAEHDGALGRRQVQANDVADLLDEQRVLGQLLALLAVGLEPERPPDPRDRGLVEPDLLRQRARRPVRRVLRRRFERLGEPSSRRPARHPKSLRREPVGRVFSRTATGGRPSDGRLHGQGEGPGRAARRQGRPGSGAGGGHRGRAGPAAVTRSSIDRGVDFAQERTGEGDQQP